MIRASVRRLSFFSKPAAPGTPELGTVLSTKPRVTGNGPFIELPRFEPMGTPSDLLLITLPQTSQINVRDGSLLAVNGDLEAIDATPNEGFQQISAASAVSLVVRSSTNRCGTYSLIENANKDEKWLILKQQSIIAWSGYDLELHPQKVLDKWLSYQSSGKGYIVVGGEEELVQVTLKEKEELLLNPGSLVATNGSATSVTVQSILGPSSHLLILLKEYLPGIPKISLPTVGITGGMVVSVRDSLANTWKTITGPIRSLSHNETWKQVTQYTHSVYSWLRLNIYVRMAARPMYLKLVGPAKVLVDAAQLLKGNSGYFLNHEILKAYEKR